MNSFTHEPDILFAQYQAQRLKDWFGSFNKPSCTILDFGCGNGLLTNFVQEVFYEATVMGIDTSATAITQAQATFGQLTFIPLTGPLLPFNNHTVDFIYAANVFHHIPTKQHAVIISEFKRILKQDAIVVILELNPYNPLTAYRFATNPLERGAHMLSAGYTQTLLQLIGHAQSWYYNFFPAFFPFLIPLERFIWRLPFGSLYASVVTNNTNHTA